MGLLAGLEALGIKLPTQEKQEPTVEASDKEVKQEEAQEESRQEKLEKGEKSLLYKKRYTCPICDKKITVPTVRYSGLNLIGTDEDFRPRYEELDPLKYDVVFCPNCGYANMAGKFEMLMPYQKKWIYEGVALKFHYENPHSEIYSYDEAYVHYQFALLCAMVGGAKTSEKAWICLKMAWLIRGKYEELNPRLPVYESRMQEYKMKELEALQLALVGFSDARNSESYPIAGMNETTLDFLISALSIKLGDAETAAELLQKIIDNKGVKNRLKERALKMMKGIRGSIPA